ncbi:alpha/beta hydrolase [Leifsonia sp. H3M29-4]|uniref:alpha/beta fold hydrolase n=1 Tax=Salinibacterium metalliresistens TaxID=3031321 RepID=UPI0023DC6D37|nr:alpha/beta hydrolase [Salinibacterium metalliresistens]MDF1479019.1 alpha/beta hydrolase [Salinibacterium metalliresistens]
MRVILVPGFWLDASSWDDVIGGIEAAGHVAEPLTRPGMHSRAADRSSITLRDNVDAVIARIDAADGPVVLVGHSGGGPMIHAAADARPDLVARAIYVDSWPTGDGAIINDELPAEHGEVPLPEWGAFDDSDLIDLTPELREQFRARAIPEAEHVAIDPLRLTDERRYDVPTTVICCSVPSAAMREFMAEHRSWIRELTSMRNLELVDLPTGHWPQFTRPNDLAAAIVAAIR